MCCFCDEKRSKRVIGMAVCWVLLLCGLVPEGYADVEPDITALKLAIEDLCNTFPLEYSRGPAYLEYLESVAVAGDVEGLKKLQQDALLDNPLLRQFDHILLIKRGEKQLGLPQNWEGNSSLPRGGYDNEIMLLEAPWKHAQLSTLCRPEAGAFVGDLELHFDGNRLLVSRSAPDGPWHICEMSLDNPTPEPLTLIQEPDVDNYEGCYLPNGNIIFSSTAPFVGVPCVTGSSHVTNLYLYKQNTGQIRRLTFEQDHNWCPRVLPNGRILYLRWEYSDIPHFVSRILFHMNPDGTEQMEFYGSNSYWPNSMFYARPLPGSTTRFAAIVGGHHGVPRMGELVLFDTAKGRREADGVLQRIPGRGKKVEPVLCDRLVDESWPRFLHPWPLSDKYFLVSAKLTPDTPWGIYLADVFDNLVLIKEVDHYALFEPVPVMPRPVPPVIPPKVDLDRNDTLVYLADVYAGGGLDGVPRGTVKSLRLFTYHFAYHGMGGQINRVGLDGPWDIKRVLGTTPVEPDGSAFFRMPANTPVSIQPLDAEGKAIQVMRSWMTGMPGETLSCVGCHESQNTAPSLGMTLASRRAPTEIKPWYGPTRGFSFIREVQPVLDASCVSCHDGRKEVPEDFTQRPPIHPEAGAGAYSNGTMFTPAYLALRRYVRTATMESDIHLPLPYEFHADTTQLLQLLQQGHYDVKLNKEAWDRLITWIDLGAPAHGTWHEIVGDEKVTHQRDRRRAMAALYAPGTDNDPEAIIESEVNLTVAQQSDLIRTISPIRPMAQRTTALQSLPERKIPLGNGLSLELALIPAAESEPAFWMGKFEVTNAQYTCFDPEHDSRLEHGDFLQFSHEERGYLVNLPEQPVARVRWNEANAFCDWLSFKTGERFTLPTEAQWEYACRAGTQTALWYGNEEVDFTEKENLADYSLAHIDTFPPWSLPSGALTAWRPAVMKINDGHHVSAPVGSYQPNPWGLFDMHGNVAEWTVSPYQSHSKDDVAVSTGKMTVCGGSWYDRPIRARSATRRAYYPWQPVFDVGFRVVASVEKGLETK